MRILITLLTLFLATFALGQQISPQDLVEFARKEGGKFPVYSLFAEESGTLRQYTEANSAFTEKKFFSATPSRIRRLLDDAPKQFILSVPGIKENVSLELVAIDLLSFDFQMMHASGIMQEELAQIQHFRGIIAGKSESFAAVTVSESGIQGSFYTKDSGVQIPPECIHTLLDGPREDTELS